MATKRVFYSFHFDNDVMRVQLIRNIGSLEENKPVNPNEWEKVRARGNAAIEQWIQDNMSHRQCVVVLIGSETYKRPWVQYEIEKAWRDKRGVVGVYIHNLKCARNGTCNQGLNPFDYLTIPGSTAKMSTVVKCYNPSSLNAYGEIANNLDRWVDEAIAIRQRY